MSEPEKRDADDRGNCSRYGGVHYGSGLRCAYEQTPPEEKALMRKLEHLRSEPRLLEKWVTARTHRRTHMTISETQKHLVALAHAHWGTETGGAYRQIIESLAYAVAVVLAEREEP